MIAPAQPPRLAALTWRQVDALRRRGHKTVLFAAGSTEQHGRHLPLLTDTLLGDALAIRVAARLPRVLVAPTLPVGVSTHHMAFPGTITLTPETFTAVVVEYVDSLAQHGFTDVLVLPSHGGNFAPLADLAASTGGRIGAARFLPYTDLTAFVGVLEHVGQRDGLGPEVSGSHAGEAETSIVLSLRPDLVDLAQARPGFLGRFDPAAAQTLFAQGIHALSPDGVLGDPRPATAARGEAYLSALTDLLVDFYRPYTADQKADQEDEES